MWKTSGFGKKALSSRKRADDGPIGITARIILADAYEHIQDGGGEVGLVHDGLTRGEQAPLELRNRVQWPPSIHALGPAPRSGIERALLPRALHLRNTNRTE